MEYAHLGRSGLSVSRLCLGTMNFGPNTPEPDAHAIMDGALDAGVNFFDTANTYGWRKGEGVTEQIIGRWFAQGAGRREKVVLATKVYGSMSDWPNDTFLSARNIITACEESLRRLQTDRIDLYQMHHVDRSTPWEEIWQAFDVLIHQGKVLYAGSSNFAGWHIQQAQEAARARHFVGLVSEQCLYNLAVRNAEEEVLPAAIANGLGVIPWSPLFGGVLAGILDTQREPVRAASDAGKRRLAEHRDQIERYEQLCKELGVPPAIVALAWLVHREGVTAPIVGPRTFDQLHELLPVVDLEFDPSAFSRLDEIFPGPGPAPEAWAW
jgi:NDP-hexose 2,3-enoyl reductase